MIIYVRLLLEFVWGERRPIAMAALFWNAALLDAFAIVAFPDASIAVELGLPGAVCLLSAMWLSCGVLARTSDRMALAIALVRRFRRDPSAARSV
jgi:hypothetical protein